MQKQRRVEQMGTKKMLPLLINMSLPAVCANIVNALYNFTDRYFVGHYVSTNALGSIGLVFPLNNLTAALTIMISIGGSTMMSRALGEGDPKKADSAFTNIAVMAGVLAAVISLLFFTCAEPLVQMCGAFPASSLYAMAVTYLRITAVGQVFLIINLALASAIRAEGNTQYAMMVTMLGAGINVALNAVMICGFHLGITGVGIATVIGQVASCTASLRYFLRKKSVIHWAGLRCFQFRVMLRVMALGSAPAVFQGLSFLNNMLVNRSLMQYGPHALGAGGGDLAISAVSVINSIESFAIMFIMGMNNALTVVISYNYGTKQYGRVKQATLTGQAVAAVVSVGMWLLMMFCPQQLFSLLSSDPKLVSYGETALHCGKLFIFGLGFQTLACMFYSAIGKPKRAVLMSISRNGLFLIPSLLILPNFFGLTGVLCSTSVSDACSLILVSLLYYRGLQDLNHLQTQQQASHTETLEDLCI